MYNFYQNNRWLIFINQRIYEVLDAKNILKTNLLLTTAPPVVSSIIWLWKQLSWKQKVVFCLTCEDSPLVLCARLSQIISHMTHCPLGPTVTGDIAQTNSAFGRHLVNRQTACVNSFCRAAEDIQCWYHMSVCTSVCPPLLLLVFENSRWMNAIRCNTLKTKCQHVTFACFSSHLLLLSCLPEWAHLSTQHGPLSFSH